ncbi:IF6 [Hepatospora eriocheir]|uniref:Eukaryotic translation initiation factor 6 n=1 Tax=Hepatospora eriocheir TaxID=1081669 RepID=A0A1X0QE80_9MICR|nr:IF6 [Hepatospora eriocheir]
MEEENKKELYICNFEREKEIGAYLMLTNTYAIVGRSSNDNFINTLREVLDIPIIETTIGGINTVGLLCAGNRHGCVVSDLCTDQELMHIRNSLPNEVALRKVSDKINTLGNNILCNDHNALINPFFENIKTVEETLKVKCYAMPLGKFDNVGSYGSMNSTGLLLHTEISKSELEELSELLSMNVRPTTVNKGSNFIGSGMATNDYVCFISDKSTKVEITLVKSILNLKSTNIDKRVIIEEKLN